MSITKKTTKTYRTFYTPDRIARAKRLIAAHPWAQRISARIFRTGDPYSYYCSAGYIAADMLCALSDDTVWELQPPTTIGRFIHPKEGANLCPVHGTEIRKFNAFNAWRIDPLNHPYKVQCPVGGEWYPSNDFHKGDMASGDYPDDGEGYVRDGISYFFLREYAHMVYGSFVMPSLRALAEAYALTDEARYGRAGCILLSRLAQQYPNYGWDRDDTALEDRTDCTLMAKWGCRLPVGGGTGAHNNPEGGLITAIPWEGNCLQQTALICDALWPYMDRDPAMLEYLRGKGLPAGDGAALREYIYSYILRAGARALMDGRIETTNEGVNHRVAATLALVMDDFSDRHPNSPDLLDYAFYSRKGAENLIMNGLYPDGGGHESIFYNSSKFGLILMARRFEELAALHPDMHLRERYFDFFAQPKARALFDHFIEIQTGDSIYPLLGDAWPPALGRRMCKAVSSMPSHHLLYAADRLDHPRYAGACLADDGDVLGGDIWEAFPEEKIRRLAAMPEAAIARQSRLVDPYGAAILETGDFARRRCVSLNYSDLIGHRQQDPLNMEVQACHVPLLLDPGYPQSWDYRWQWDANSMAHNTVTVDETQPPLNCLNAPIDPLYVRGPGTGELAPPSDMGAPGHAHWLVAGAGVHAVMIAHEHYRGVTLGHCDATPVRIYQRMTLMIDLNAHRSYIVDLFSVDGGEQHDQTWHAFPTAHIVAPDLPWRAQNGGTLAGGNIALYGGYTDRWGRIYEKGNAPSFFSDIRRADLSSSACWTWPTDLPEGDALDVHLVPLAPDMEIIMAKGSTPIRKPEDYLIVRRMAFDGGMSRFLTVLEPRQGEASIADIRLIPHGSEDDRACAVSLEIGFRDGNVHRLSLNPDECPAESPACGASGFRLEVLRDGTIARSMVAGNVGMEHDPGWIHARVMAIEEPDSAAPRITVSLGSDDDCPHLAEGRWIRIHSEARGAMYRIVRCRRMRSTVCELTLDKTLLLSRGQVAGFRDNMLMLQDRLPLAKSLRGTVVDAGDFAALVTRATEDGDLELTECRGCAPAPGIRASIRDFAIGARIAMQRQGGNLGKS